MIKQIRAGYNSSLEMQQTDAPDIIVELDKITATWY
jgi:hypothetical protein